MDWSNGATTAVPQSSLAVEKKSPSEERTLGAHESRDNEFLQTTEEASEEMNEPHTKQPEEMNTKHEIPNSNTNTDNLMNESSAEPEAESQKEKQGEAEETVTISSMEPLILVGTDKPVESVKTEENLTSEMEESQPSESAI